MRIAPTTQATFESIRSDLVAIAGRLGLSTPIVALRNGGELVCAYCFSEEGVTLLAELETMQYANEIAIEVISNSGRNRRDAAGSAAV